VPQALQGEPCSSPTLLLLPNGERQWRVIQFLPIHTDGNQLAAVLARIGPPSTPDAEANSAATLPAQLLQLRERLRARYRIEQVVAASWPMRRVLEQVTLAAAAPVQVLFQGEVGTGRERLARSLHALTPQADQPFVRLDCPKLTSQLLDQQLSEDGLLASCEKWATLLLKEPAALPGEIQQRLARYLRDRSPQDQRRLLLASSADLNQETARGVFDRELLELFSTLIIPVPPLRERRTDLPTLVQQIIEEHNTTGEQQVVSIHATSLEMCRAYSWPGNVSQLVDVIRAAALQANGGELRPEHLPLVIQQAAQIRAAPRTLKPLPLDELLAEAEKRIIQLALKDADGNDTRAAERLGISPARLRRRLRTVEHQPEAPSEGA
jgi:DNA-binding NtrC family response regulator